MDVADAASIDRARDLIGREARQAGLAGLVNNAGIAFASPLEFAPLDELRQLFEVNVFGLLAVTQAFLPLLRQARGRVVNVSSAASIAVAPFHGPYSATKCSLNALSDALRLELLPFGIHVANIICGSIQTPIWEKAEQFTGQIAERFPAQAVDLYGPAFCQLVAFFRKMGREGVSPEAPARAIAHALTARRPKNTYLVGADARRYAVLQVLVHGRLRDRIVLRTIGLSATGGGPVKVDGREAQKAVR
jgi:NAD(P)-dependent dehydrogenase (short-subunit alcohol dehydrogenase family)